MVAMAAVVALLAQQIPFQYLDVHGKVLGVHGYGNQILAGLLILHRLKLSVTSMQPRVGDEVAILRLLIHSALHFHVQQLGYMVN
jgi:hypothetical protein